MQDPFQQINIIHLLNHLSGCEDGAEINHSLLPKGGILHHIAREYFVIEYDFFELDIQSRVLSFWDNANRHRISGPALYGYKKDGSYDYAEWYMHDNLIDTSKMQKWAEERNEDLNNLSENAIMALQFEYRSLI